MAAGIYRLPGYIGQRSLVTCGSYVLGASGESNDLLLKRNLICRDRSTLSEAAETTSAVTSDLNQAAPFSAMPGPPGLPVIGTLWEYVKKDGLKFNKMFEVMKQRAEEYGPVYREKIGHMLFVIVTDPAEYAKVIHVDGRYPHRIELQPMVQYRKQRGLVLGTVNGQGEEWYRHRTVLSKKMLRPKEVQAYIPGMDEVAEDFINRLAAVQNQDGRIDQLETEMFKWAMESICTVLFEERIGCLADSPSLQIREFIENLMGFFHLMQPLMYGVPLYRVLPTPTWRRYCQHADRVMAIGQSYVDKKVNTLKSQALYGLEEGEAKENSEFLTYLIQQRSLTAKEANSHAVDMMMGAIETTANASMWTLYCLSRTPEAQHALYQEVCEVLPEDGVVTLDTLNNIPYVKACLKETFRLYPITYATSRVIPQDVEIGGYRVPAGTHVQANLYGMGRDPSLFDDPLAYRPERWLRAEGDNPLVKSLSNLTFGHGPRMCLGRRLAEQEIYILLTKLIRKFRVESSPENDVLPVLNTVMTADRPFKLRFTSRQ